MNANSLLAQDSKLHGQPAYIKLNGETEVKEVIVPLRDSLNSVNILVKSSIQGGELTIEIFDPTGEEYGNITLGCQLNNTVSQNSVNKQVTAKDFDVNADKAFGNIFRTIKNPKRGAWKARVTNKGAAGNILIQFTRQSTSLVRSE